MCMEESKSDTCVRRCVTFIYAEANRNVSNYFWHMQILPTFNAAPLLKKQNLYNFSKAVITIVAIIWVINEVKFHSRRI